jgi:toxin-antitoxin system PIN domain toxin
LHVIDLNILLYAVNRDAPEHSRARQWLDTTLGGDEPVGLPWIVLLAFLRIATNARVFARPLTRDEALSVVDAWLGQPSVTALAAGDGHWAIVRSLLRDAAHSGGVGGVTSDAHLAALAIEHGAQLWSADSDFRRFDGLRWKNPLG